MTTPIDAEIVPPQTQALTVRQAGAIDRALTTEELHERLEFIRTVMRTEMKEGQDYGKIPGCGDKPTLLQPGAQKLLMTFNLCEYVKKEEMRELRGDHREYAFTIAIKAPNGKEWDGVGTCSTLEAKYRYRSQARKCPSCGRPTILQSKKGKPEWFCWRKKGGCGAVFDINAPAIVSQSEGKTENDNPADCWNTVRKIAFKRALVAASINATNTSELWTQDIEDGQPDPEATEPQSEPDTPREVQPTRQERKTAPVPAQARPDPTESDRQTMILRLEREGLHDISQEFFTKLCDPAVILPNEGLADIPLWAVPATEDELRALISAVNAFGNGEQVGWPYKPGKPVVQKAGDVAKKVQPKPPESHAAIDQSWYGVIVPVPHKGEKRDEYMKHPDTIGSLYDSRHDDDIARKRLWWFVKEWHPAPREYKGKTYQPSEADHKCRAALDAFAGWWEMNHPGEKL